MTGAAGHGRRRWADLIEAARAAGRYWVVLEDGTGSDGAYRRREMHLPSGVVVDAYGNSSPDGSRYYTRSYFANRRTGEDLSCGSRQWDRGEFTRRDELDKAVAEARKNVESRFAGMVAIYERQLQRKF